MASRTFTADNLNTTNKQFNSRTLHKTYVAVTSLQIILPNFYLTSAKAEAGTGGVASVTAAIEYGGVCTQVLFSGVATGSIPNNGYLLSDSTAVTIPAGANFFVRVFWTSAFGSPFTVVGGIYSTTLGERLGAAASGLSDLTMTPGVFTDTGVNNTIYGPAAILGQTTAATVAIIGDSRAMGYGDTGDSTTDRGEIARSVGISRAYINVAVQGDRLNRFLTSSTNRKAIAAYCSHAVCEYGINDFDLDARTTAQMIADVQTLATAFGKPMYCSTISPHADATNANPANATSNGKRTAYNDTLRASGISGIAGYFDVASVTESSLNSGLWTTGYSADFLHANQTGTLAVKNSGVINPAVFTR